MDAQILSSAAISYMVANPSLILLMIWAIIWKLIALWKAAKNNHLTIFIVLGVLNTAGIAEIIYIVWMYLKEKKLSK